MVEPLPKWIMKRYSKLWKAFGSKDFSFDKAVQTLKEKDSRIIAIILSELKKAGWITIKKDPTNTRKKLYKLKNPEQVIKEIK